MKFKTLLVFALVLIHGVLSQRILEENQSGLNNTSTEQEEDHPITDSQPEGNSTESNSTTDQQAQQAQPEDNSTDQAQEQQPNDNSTDETEEAQSDDEPADEAQQTQPDEEPTEADQSEEQENSSEDKISESLENEQSVSAADGYKVKCFWFNKRFDVFDLTALKNKDKNTYSE